MRWLSDTNPIGLPIGSYRYVPLALRASNPEQGSSIISCSGFGAKIRRGHQRTRAQHAKKRVPYVQMKYAFQQFRKCNCIYPYAWREGAWPGRQRSPTLSQCTVPPQAAAACRHYCRACICSMEQPLQSFDSFQKFLRTLPNC